MKVCDNMLSSKKKKVIELLLKGNSIYSISDEVKVSRMTIYRWKKEDEEFKQELEEKQEEIRQEIRYKFLDIAYTKGIKSLEKIVDGLQTHLCSIPFSIGRVSCNVWRSYIHQL